MFVLAMEFSKEPRRHCWLRSWQQVSVAIAEGSHPFPSRTRKLSPPAPMVLGTRVPGRVGRRRARTDEGPLGDQGSFVVFRPFAASPPTPIGSSDHASPL